MNTCIDCNYPLMQEDEHFEMGFGETGPRCNDCEG